MAEGNKYTELARKLKALAESGLDGERVNAQDMLKALMEKHNISMEEVESEDVEFRWFTFNRELRDIFVQVALSVCGTRVKRYQQRHNPKTGEFKMALELNHADWIEVEAKFGYYGNLFKDELDVLFIAFVQKHRLYNPDNSVKEVDISQLDEKELEKIRRAARLSMNLKQGEYHRQLMSSLKLDK